MAELLAYDASVRSLLAPLSQWLLFPPILLLLSYGSTGEDIVLRFLIISAILICALIWNNTRRQYQKARHLICHQLSDYRADPPLESSICAHLVGRCRKWRRFLILQGLYILINGCIFTCLYLDACNLMKFGPTTAIVIFYLLAATSILWPFLYYRKETCLQVSLLLPYLLLYVSAAVETLWGSLAVVSGSLGLLGFIIYTQAKAYFTAAAFCVKCVVCFMLPPAVFPFFILLAVALAYLMKKHSHRSYKPLEAVRTRTTYFPSYPRSPFSWKTRLHQIDAYGLGGLFTLGYLAVCVYFICRTI